MNNDPSINWNRIAVAVMDSFVCAGFAMLVGLAAQGEHVALVIAAYMVFAKLQAIGDRR